MTQEVWSAKDFLKMGDSFLWDLAEGEYRAGNLKKFKELLKTMSDDIALRDPTKAGFGVIHLRDSKVKNIISLIVSKNDVQTFEELSLIAPEIFKNDNIKGSLCSAILSGNKSFFDMLIVNAKPDQVMSRNDAKEFYQTRSNLSYDPIKGLNAYNTDTYVGMSPLFWAMILRENEMVSEILKNIPTIEYKKERSESIAGKRFGEMRKVTIESAWETLAFVDDKEMIQMFFENKEYRDKIVAEAASSYLLARGSSGGSFLKVLNKEQREFVFEFIKNDPKLERNFLDKWFDSAMLRQQIMEYDPEKYIELFKSMREKEKTERETSYGYGRKAVRSIDIKNEISNLLTVDASLSLLDFLIKEEPEVLNAEMEYYPGSTRRMVRDRGVILMAMQSNKYLAAEYFIKLKNGIHGEEKNIEEALKRGWFGKNAKTEALSAEEKRTATDFIDKIKLKKLVVSGSQDKKVNSL